MSRRRSNVSESSTGIINDRRAFQGPINDSLLVLQPHHRSRQIFVGDRTYSDRCEARSCDGTVWGAWHKEKSNSELTVRYVEELGFGTYFRLGKLNVDYGLITALLERYRPETHTFHLPCGEVMISLQDVEVLLGLRVDGEAVPIPPNVLPPDGWDAFLERELGLQRHPEHYQYLRSGQYMWARCLRYRLERPADGSHNDARQRAKCFVLWMLGTGLLITSSKNEVHLDYVRLISDERAFASYSWGSAVLAYLMHDMAKKVMEPAAKNVYVNGAGNLLQLWAFEHIPAIRPHIVGAHPRDPLAPYGVR